MIFIQRASLIWRKFMEIYVSTDCETDGPIPGMNSLLSFGSAAYTADKKLLATFTANLELLEGAAPHPATLVWWQNQPEAWAACRRNAQAPEMAISSGLEPYQVSLSSWPIQPRLILCLSTGT
jgi:hypothetical protein